ncbi:hypothetical protein FMN50_22565 [Rhodobacterales bacterium]|nr:hypothetical protein FMN50_22565 [Rhodobacterales bacterium]
MITARKRILSAGAPAIFGAVIMAGALTAAELLTGNPADAQTSAPGTKQVVEQVAPVAQKGDLKVDLANVSDRKMRCVSRYKETTCTGWPVTGDVLAYNAE